MKLMMIIASDEYIEEIAANLMEHNFIVAEIGSNGDFLQYGQTVLILNIKEEDIDYLVTVLKKSPNGSIEPRTFNDEVFIYILNANQFIKVEAMEQV